MKSFVLKRTFQAKQFPKASEERGLLNKDTLTSEYMPSQKWLVRTPAVMNDGSPNPAQWYHDKTFETKRQAEIYADENDSAICSRIAAHDRAIEERDCK